MGRVNIPLGRLGVILISKLGSIPYSGSSLVPDPL
jgi:hypothetical protein